MANTHATNSKTMTPRSGAMGDNDVKWVRSEMKRMTTHARGMLAKPMRRVMWWVGSKQYFICCCAERGQCEHGSGKHPLCDWRRQRYLEAGRDEVVT